MVEQHAATYGCKECEDGGGAAMSKPLFLYYAPTAIHAPTSVPDDFYNAHEVGLGWFGLGWVRVREREIGRVGSRE